MSRKFRTECNEITLRELCNLSCISGIREAVLYDYNASSILNRKAINDPGMTVNEIPEKYADWFVEGFESGYYKDASDQINLYYEFEIREP